MYSAPLIRTHRNDGYISLCTTPLRPKYSRLFHFKVPVRLLLSSTIQERVHFDEGVGAQICSEISNSGERNGNDVRSWGAAREEIHSNVVIVTWPYRAKA